MADKTLLDLDLYDAALTGDELMHIVQGATGSEVDYRMALSNLETYLSSEVISDEAYDATTWDGVTDEAPSKNVVRDKIETIVSDISSIVSDEAYDATSWDGVTDEAPSKNVVRDEIETRAAHLAQNMQVLTDGANISWNMSNGGFASVTLGGNRTLDNPTNVKAGGLYRLRVVQDATGGRTLSFGSNYKFPGGISVTLSSGAGDIDLFEFIAYDSSTLYLVNALFDIQ